MYSVTVTPGQRQKIGTVNNCSCEFFKRHHSSCKHMFVVARRTKFRISERVDPLNSQTTTATFHNNNTLGNSATSNTPRLHARHGTSVDQPHSSFVPPLHSTPPCPDHLPPTPCPAPPTPPSAQLAPNSTPQYSLRSYLDMCGGQTRDKHERAITWANHLQGSGILQLHPSSTRKHL